VRAGILLVHGYTGSPRDLEPLAGKLSALSGDFRVVSLLLPGHDAGAGPVFDEAGFIGAIRAAAGTLRAEGREIVVVGHSTGGILALAAIAKHALSPRLLVLAAAPGRIDGSDLSRWRNRPRENNDISFTSLARMVSLTNAVGDAPVAARFPVLLLHGDRDELVPCEKVLAWRGRFSGPVRTVIVPGAGHDIFRGARGGIAVDAVARAAADALREETAEEAGTIGKMTLAEPKAASFLALWPASAGHLARSPGVRRAFAAPAGLGPEPDNEPVFANIEITTRCDLGCPYCARRFKTRQEKEMPAERFDRILDLLPHAYRVTLVGLGEPLLHPRIFDFVARASSRGRRVAVVTNAVHLSEETSHRLIDAGLDAISFSLDAAVPEPAAKVRPGAGIDNVVANIETFTAISARTRPVAKAVFAAVSTATAPFLDRLVETVARLGVDALMLSDLNFEENLPHTLWRNSGGPVRDTVHRAVRKAFALRLPVLSVSGLEEIGIAAHYEKHLLIPPARLYQRSARRRHCLSPWQTLPVAVDGAVTICDCQPREELGNLLDRPLGEIWNGKAMADHRGRMLGEEPPGPCVICPRF